MTTEAMGGPLTPQLVGTNFLGAQFSDTPGYSPPDSMGDVGPSQIVVCVNGLIRSFNKSGLADGTLNANTDNFFASVLGGSSTSDPRVRYDRLSGRWFITMITVNTPNFVLLAVSSGPVITSSSSFTFFSFQADASNFGDYDTLGVDANALYIGVNVFRGNTFVNTTGFVVNKANLINGALMVTPFTSLLTGRKIQHGPFTPQGVNNDDPAATEGYFIGVDAGSLGTLVVRRISNPGGTPSISASISITVPSTTAPLGGVPALGSTATLDDLDDRLFAARMHNGSLWTAHNIEVNSAGIASSTGGRDGARWYQLVNMTGTPTVAQSGTLYDSTSSNPRNFWIPSCAMSGQGHMALGCSVAGNTEPAEIAAAGRLLTDAAGTIQSPTVVQTSTSTYNLNDGTNPHRWGDFSVTTVDPNDDMTFWTVQEYCNAADSWGVRVIQLRAPPPALPLSCSPAIVTQGMSNVSVVVTGVSTNGSGFFDPGTNYPNHISAMVSGVGVTVNSVAYRNPTNVTLSLAIASTAPPDDRTITVTNPDGQSATSSTGLLTIVSGNVAQLLVQPGSLNFGTLATGMTAQTSFIVTNLGSAPLTGTAMALGGPFTVVTGKDYAVVGFASTNVVVQFAPAVAGAFSNGIAFSSDGGSSTNAVTGVGVTVPVAVFRGSPTLGAAPLHVAFEDTSTGTITNRVWDFGDGRTTNTLATNVVHVYAAAGTNTVTLMTSGPVGVSTNVKQDYVVATNLPVLQLFVNSAYGGAVPPVGTNVYAAGREVTCAVTNSPVFNGATQYEAAGWTMTGNDPVSGSGTNLALILTNDAVLVWQWKTNYQFAVAGGANGTINGDSNGWRASGGSVTVTAVPDTYYHFAAWAGDVPPPLTNSNPLTLIMDQPRAVLAAFAENLGSNYGTPFTWLAAYGFTNDMSSVELLIGSNGVPLWQSYGADLNPTSAGSRFVVVLFTNSAGHSASVGFNSSTGRVYGLQGSANAVMSNGWFDVSGRSNIVGTGGIMSLDDTNAASPQFYRIRVQIPP